MPQTLTFEEFTKGPETPKAQTFETFVGEPRYEENIRDVFALTEKLQRDPEVRQAYVRKYWEEQGAILAKQHTSPFFGDVVGATTHLLHTLPKEKRARIQKEKSDEWQKEAQNIAMGRFFKKRSQLANALWKQVHISDPEISDEDAYKHMHQQLEQHGYQPPGAGRLPPLVMRDGQLENEYEFGWTEFRHAVKGTATRTYDIATAIPRLAGMAAEAVTDWADPSGGAYVTGTNVYREMRIKQDYQRQRIEDYLTRGMAESVPYMPEGFSPAMILGEQLPQFAITAGAAGLVKLGIVSKFVGRTIAAASMFAVETPTAYSEYLRYAEEQGMDPREASQIAAGGAVVYGTVAGVLESYGPFELMAKANPMKFSWVTRKALAALVEGGTEGSQSLSQFLIAYGLDLKQPEMDDLWVMLNETLAGMIMGPAAEGFTHQKGRTAPQIAAPSTTIDPGEMGPAVEIPDTVRDAIAETPSAEEVDLTPEVTPEVVPEAPRTLPRDAVMEHMIETTPESERTDMTRAAFESVLGTLRYGQESFTEVDVPISQLDLNLLGQEETAARQADIAKYAAQEAVTAPAVVAGSVDDSGTFMVVDGVRRVQAAQQRGDTTVKVLLPQSDAAATTETLSPEEVIKQQIREIAQETPEALAQHQKEIEAGEPELVEKSISLVREKLGKEGSKITDDESLGRVGTEIAKILGIPEGTVIDWKFKTVPDQVGPSGTHFTEADGSHTILIRQGLKRGRALKGVEMRKTAAGVQGGRITLKQTTLYRTIVHELGHIMAPPIGGGPFKGDPRRQIHHDEFVQWVEEGVSKLIGTTYIEAPAVDPLVSPENVPLSEEMKPIFEHVKSFLQDEDGYWDPQATGRVIEGGITIASEGAGSILTGVTALTDEAAFLHRTDAGTLADELFSDAQAKAQSKIGEYNAKFLGAYDKLTTEEKRWLEHIREDGQTNWATLREHPDRLDAASIPRSVITLAQVAQAQQTDSAQGAINARLPQARMEETVGPRGGKILKRIVGIFKPAKEGRYYRILTPKGSAAIHSQSGPIFEALIDWLEVHADRNPNLPDTAADIREKLAGERASGKTRQAGSLEYTRVFKELPTALEINRKWEALQEMRPVNHFMSSNESQWRRIAFWDVIQDRLLMRYGKFDEDTGETTLPHPQNKELTDVDGLVDRLRKDVVQQEGQRRKGNPKGAERSYNRMLEHYFRQFSGGVMEDVFTLGDRDNKLMQTASIVDRNIMSSILSFSGLWDVCQPTASAHIVGYRRLTKAYAKVMADVLAHPTKYSAEYQAIGAVSLRHHDYILRKTSRELTGGVLERTLPQAMMAGAEAMEQWSQTVTATAFDLWSRDANGNLKDADARMLRKHLRLTDAEVLEVAQGKMSDQTQAKIIQNGVKTTNYLAEDPMHRGLLQNVPLLRFLVPFTSVVSGNLRAAGRVVTDIVDDVQRIKKGNKAAVKDLLKDLSKMMAFLVACFGRGFVQNMMRRAITGKPMIRPEEEDDWAGTLLDCLGEGAVFGPYYRLLEAAKYSGGDPNRMAVNMLPRAAIWIEMISALGGVGQYEGTAWGKRMEKWGYKVSPAARSFKNWHNKMIHPGRAEYKEVRQRVRLFLEAEGEEPKRGFGPTNRYYYAVFEAVRDQNDVALEDAIVEYKEWAKAKGKTSEEARTALRSALYARRPMNLREERVQKFLAGLSDTQREMAEQQQRDYTVWLDRVTRRPGVKRKRKTKAKRKRKVVGGDWYVTD